MDHNPPPSKPKPMPAMDPVSTEFQLSTVSLLPLILISIVLALAVRMTIQQRLRSKPNAPPARSQPETGKPTYRSAPP